MAGGGGNSCGSRRQTVLLVLLHSSQPDIPRSLSRNNPTSSRRPGWSPRIHRFHRRLRTAVAAFQRRGQEEAEHISSAAIQLLLFLFFALFLKFIDCVCVCVCVGVCVCVKERERGRGRGRESKPERQREKERVFEAVGLVKQRLIHTRGLTLPWLSTQELTAVALRV